jgi:KRAB domain-containing zinc finger protein
MDTTQKKKHSWPHFCRSCSVAFNTVEKLKQHNLEKHSHKYTCRTCDKEFTLKNALSVHIKTIHKGGERFPCTWQDCDKSFYRQDVLKDHMNKHTGLRLYSCKKCEKTYSSKRSLNHHWKVCKTDGLACTKCGQVLLSRGCLKDHNYSRNAY